MKKLNLFFFGDEKISKHDFFWFYGMSFIIIFLCIFSKIVTLF